MGIFKSRYSSCSTSPTSNAPDPTNFVVHVEQQIGNLWVSIIHYPGCTNVEGMKCVVSTIQPSKVKMFDPHFDESGVVVARFNPKANGFFNALNFARSLS